MFTAGVVCLKLPETGNMPMPETLEDLEVKPKVVKVAALSDDKVKLLEGDILENERELDEINA